MSFAGGGLYVPLDDRFVQVVAEDAGVRIRRSGAPWAIEVDPGFDARTLRRVIEVLGS